MPLSRRTVRPRASGNLGAVGVTCSTCSSSHSCRTVPPSGLADVHQELTLDPRCTAYTSVLNAQVLDTHGNPVVELCGTAQGKRPPRPGALTTTRAGLGHSCGAPRLLSRPIHPFIATKR